MRCSRATVGRFARPLFTTLRRRTSADTDPGSDLLGFPSERNPAHPGVPANPAEPGDQVPEQLVNVYISVYISIEVTVKY